MIKTKFENIIFKEIIYTHEGVEIEYIHYLGERECFKKLYFSNVKSCKSVFPEGYYYFSILEELDLETDFQKLIYKNKKENKLYLIDADYTRIMIKFKDFPKKLEINLKIN